MTSATLTDHVRERLDHLVVATPDLDLGMRWIEEQLGIEAVAGGSHPVYGTRNTLVGLGDRCYLEIIGPDPKILSREEVKVFGIHELERPVLVTWAARGRDLEVFVEAARREMIDLGAVTLGSRRQPDGSELTWTFTDPLAARNGGVLPFFIDWGMSAHPAQALPGGCKLEDLSLHHPHADEIRRRLRVLDLDMPVHTAKAPRISAVIRTPAGTVDL